ncbi:hypothetical protein EDC44_14214 [Cricetibacter osteomyelitidis]|uniref:Uncharacterized protein n=1 Tax=Cricetibacter osteomyelitidis TaxID=1521931 RepID=A0A4R2SMD0_9PAST|nr:hypothetical protein EDC44_14214 [Cricetibacter osteomyelitidis]
MLELLSTEISIIALSVIYFGIVLDEYLNCDDADLI